MSTMERTVVSDWPTPTVSMRMTSKPAASPRDHGFTRFPGHAAQGASGRGRADEGVFFPGELFHTGFVPHDGTSGDGGGGVDGKDGHFEAFSAQVGAEGLDEGGFARSRNARDADPDGIAGVGKELGDEFREAS